MIIADFSNTNNTTVYPKSYLYQYNKGQHLNIIGIDLEYFKDIKFLTEQSVMYVQDVEEIANGFRVMIPDKLLSESGHYKDYWITAYINFECGNDNLTTIKEVKILVKFVSANETSDSQVTIEDDEHGNVFVECSNLNINYGQGGISLKL